MNILGERFITDLPSRPSAGRSGALRSAELQLLAGAVAFVSVSFFIRPSLCWSFPGVVERRLSLIRAVSGAAALSPPAVSEHFLTSGYGSHHFSASENVLKPLSQALKWLPSAG